MSTARRATGVAAALLVLLSAAPALAGTPRYQFKPFDRLVPLDRVIIMTTGEPETRPLTVLDLTTGVALKDCPTGLWRGKVVFVGGLGGDVEYDGQLWRCFPFGDGIVRYPNDTSYSGVVNSYVDDAIKAALVANEFDARVIDADSVHMAVREGRGTAVRADGKVLTGIYRRGEQFDPDPRQPDQRLANLEAALAALAEAGRQAAADAERQREEARRAEARRQAEAARLAEERRVAEEARLAEEARAREEAERQRRLAVAADAAQLRGMLDGSQPSPGAAARKAGVPACANALAAQRKFFAAVNQRRPADATLLADLKTTLYALGARLALLDKACAGQPEYGERGLDAVAKARLEDACRGIAADPVQCEPEIAW